MKKPKHNWSKNALIDPCLESYHIRLTRRWAKDLAETAAGSASLTQIVYDFILAMRSVCVVASLPFTVAAQQHRFVVGYTKKVDAPPIQKIVNAFSERLSRSLALDPDTRRQVALECHRIAGQCDSVSIPPPFSLTEVWESYLSEKGFQISLWESQRSALVSTYNYYESFLTRCMAVAVKQQRYNLRKKFPDDFAREFGKEAFDECWGDPRIQILRLTRNAIVHEGGRDSHTLRQMGHNYRVQDGVIYIFPEDLKAAIRLIERCASQLVSAAAKHPNFGTRVRQT